MFGFNKNDRGKKRTVRRDSSYETRKRKEGERQRKLAASGRDIGELPEVVDQERRERCRFDLQLFCETYLKQGIFKLGWSAFHLTAIKILQKLILEGGLFSLAFPRASGKSALCVAAILWCLLYGHRPYAAVVCGTDPKAIDFIQDVKTQLEVNDLLLADFPAVCFPIRALERTPNRAMGQTYHGQPTRIVWSAERIVMPTIPGEASSGFRLAAVSITGDIRGLRFTRSDGVMCRPSFVIIDDPQTDESADSPEQTRKRIDITNGAILGLSGPDETMAAAMTVTVIKEGDYADHYLAAVDWQGERVGILNSLPENMQGWQEYRRIQQEAIAQKAGVAPINDYYIANRQTLDRGCIPSWEDRYDRKNEISAIQAAMNLYFKVGRKKFFAEYMNDPAAAEEASQKKLSARAVRERLNGLPRYRVPLEHELITAFVDIQHSLLWYALVAWRYDFTGAVIDYGWFPEQRRREFTLNDLTMSLQTASGASDVDLDAAISWGLKEFGGNVLSRRYFREDGVELSVKRCHVDIGDQAAESAVSRFCRRSPWAPILFPSRGSSVKVGKVRRISEWTPKPGERHPPPNRRRDCEWMITSMRKHRLRECMFDPNFWKSNIDKSLRLPVYAAGSISLYGSSPEEHGMLSEHLTSHRAIAVEWSGYKGTAWQQLPGQRDDLLDCLVGCAVGASIEGCELRDPVTVAIGGRKVKSKPRKRVTYLE